MLGRGAATTLRGFWVGAGIVGELSKCILGGGGGRETSVGV